jgi:ATP-dependent Clp protease ATP-binding subunit ClpC
MNEQSETQISPNGLSYEWFSARAVKIMGLAREESTRLGHSFIGTEQLLVALIREGDGVPARILTASGIKLDAVQGAVENVIGRGSFVPVEEMTLTAHFRQTLNGAWHEMKRGGHTHLRAEHLLTGLINETECKAVKILRRLDVDIEGLKNQLIDCSA